MIYGLLGEKLSHSFSKEIHNKIADYDYKLLEVAKEDLKSFLEKKDFCAINVTIPYKEAVIPYLYEVDKKAQEIGAVNTICNKCGKLFGYNTDFDGMMALIKKEKIKILGKKVIILGTGGTSKTAKAVCNSLSAGEVIRVSRTKKEDAVTYDEVYKNHTDSQIIINTTPCGMYPKTEDMPIDLKRFGNLEGVLDVIYNPLSTALVTQAKEMGILASGGLYMLVAQAVFACEHFLGKKLNDDIINKVYCELVSKKQNIVLIGMPGAGKTTIGKILAKEQNKEFLDTDEKIEKSQQKSPAEIINESGERAFRDIEEEVIKVVSQKTGTVIATGGGAILREQNIKRLKQNGVVVFLDRDIKKIIPTSNRPLSSSADLLEARYKERYPKYMSLCDIHIKVGDDAKENASYIAERIENL